MVRIAKTILKSVGVLFVSLLFSIGFVVMSTSARVSAAESPGKNILFILDASGSMWGKINGKAKIDIAKDVLVELIKELPGDISAGLQVYGHRSKGDCEDIEVLVPPGKGDRHTLLRKIESIQPKGKTPITKSLKLAGEQLKSLKGSGAIILVSDGKETCGEDPCQLVRELRRQGIEVTVHVVGFDVTDEEKQQLSCIAEAGGGKYFTAKSAVQLKEALKEVKEEVIGIPKGKILYYGRPGQEKNVWYIFTINADGTNETRLTNDPNYQDMEPAWSPDGKRIVFVSNRGSIKQKAFYNIFVMDADGGNITRLTDFKNHWQYMNPSWSPDGKRIAFVSDGDGGRKKTPYNLFVMDADGGNITRLTDVVEIYEQILQYSWSPDGNRIVYDIISSKPPEYNSTIYVVNSNGKNKIRLTSDWGSTPSWSPDGEHIVFEGPPVGIYIMDADGSNKVRLTIDVGNLFWSPDGKRIGIAKNDGIKIINADGTNKVQLIHKKGYYFHNVTCSPDGKYISFHSYRNVVGQNTAYADSKIYIMSLDGKYRKCLTKSAGTYYGPSWCPSPK